MYTIQANPSGTRSIEVSNENLRTIEKYALFRHLIDSTGIVDEAVLDKLKPVSYTHLDVYKRQPVDRSRKTSLVDQMVKHFNECKKFHLAITPEGTRKANPNWKKGFYYIALKAQVPIVLIGIDYSKKMISATKAIMPSGDIDKDMREIKLYFKDFQGKHPENFALGEI